MSDNSALRAAAVAFLNARTWSEFREARAALEAAGYDGETAALALGNGLVRTSLDPDLMARLGLQQRPAPAPETRPMPTPDPTLRRFMG